MTIPGKAIKSEEVIMFDSDGSPTENKDEAVKAEVTTTFEDGTKRREYWVTPRASS